MRNSIGLAGPLSITQSMHTHTHTYTYLDGFAGPPREYNERTYTREKYTMRKYTSEKYPE
jgi:hypothetical protein